MSREAMTVILVLLVINAILIIVAYSMCVISHNANERADRMYRKWKEEVNERDGRSDKTQ